MSLKDLIYTVWLMVVRNERKEEYIKTSFDASEIHASNSTY
jgi:hypothetical protein